MALPLAARRGGGDADRIGSHQMTAVERTSAVTLLDRVNAVSRVVPRSARRVPTWVAVLAVPLVVAVVAFGVWVTGAALTEDATAAMVLTGAWFTLAGLLAVLAAMRWRSLALPVLVTYAISSAAIGGYLLYTSSVDRVVTEDVVVAEPAPPPGAGAGQSPDASSGPVAVAAGRFRSQAHETTGTATLVERPGGGRVLTLTGFATDPGPDLRVYLVAGDGSSTRGAVDLGGLKGNKGDQQYDVPDDAPTGAVIIWCRAFSVAFGTAKLT